MKKCEEFKRELLRRRELKKLLKKLPKHSVEAISIRKELGIPLLSDLVVVPLRVCKHCGKRAYSAADLAEFVYHETSRHNHMEVCVVCMTVINHYKYLKQSVRILGQHTLLPKTRSCSCCGRVEVAGTAQSFFYRNASVCNVCMGTHVEAFGRPMAIQYEPREFYYYDREFSNIAAASKELNIPYSTIWNSLLGIYKNTPFKLKGCTNG